MRLRWDGIIARLSYRFNFLAIRADWLPELAEDLVRQGGSSLAAIITQSTPAATAAAKATTTTTAIVAMVAVDPVGAGLTSSLARPGANVTGVVLFAEEMNAKRVELLHALPGVSHLAAVTGPRAAPPLPI